MAGAPTPNSPTASIPAVSSLVQQLQQTRDLAAAVLDSVSFSLLSEADAMAVLGTVEDLGRRVDAARVASAADIAVRSRSILGHESLAHKNGASSGTDLITRLTRISFREANRRVRLSDNVLPRMAGTSVLPPFYPAVADALAAGDLGVDAAENIVTALDRVAARVAPDDLGMAERTLVAHATGAVTEETLGLPGEGFAFPADLVRGMAGQWQAHLDPDGTAPTEPVAQARSTVGFGLFRDGLYPLRGGVTPELRGIMNGIFDTYLSAHAAPAFPTEEEQARMDAGELIPGAEAAALSDDRNGGEKRADILRGVLEAATRDAGTPSMGGAAPTVMIHVNQSDLVADRGVGWIDGVEAPISLTSVTQAICAGGFQQIVCGPNDEVLTLSTERRFFNRSQRRAIAARDGGCIIPGCTVPAAWCEVHHVIPWSRDGRTAIENGVLLCWYHHHSIDTSGWEIRMARGKPEVRAPLCFDPGRRWRAAGNNRAGSGLRSRQARPAPD
ncbi:MULTISPECIES: HNH endonuclease signature motif containing protein [Cryobacterium]|uniref:HNH endonuclease n=1 Tax=Cryobacterium breve TaxID=1259258 RepID=A0ABY2IW59_9MICO|nr:MULTISPECIES: HNH endonuclease signature motif containing protein [Cryobacterium]TFC96163.1 HNH endonuclease [Cryobacterium breve]TFC98067.1 HNH endonuclease [Cryobacterium sp. TmT3-12]